MTPILWSFRRCPYAMRARLALASAAVRVELREVVLRDKPPAFLETSPSATVPCLDGPDGVNDESLDIMLWALRRHDPESLLEMPEEGFDLIDICDGRSRRRWIATNTPAASTTRTPAWSEAARGISSQA